MANTTKEAKNFYQLERVTKGFASHRRIQIMELLAKEPELSVEEITERLEINYKTAADHVRRLAIAGLIMKRSDGFSVRQKLTPRGETILAFLRKLE
ncbi:MAG: hypothetical protein A2418_02945 [Candidatus Brennerbacteria bacterium RIFOXYC1_FULL_41_11]|nr:MAG: hypothetical protein A2391_00490 [Candidatus Brennerbacteria bacterium RIFOXYB1_FULL_41_13]OGY40456.1 MAG: hypothetical protein A2418_02945 [Candidatus Brennerbacteria bacterium RIFOXYC1_FULL_41_11]